MAGYPVDRFLPLMDDFICAICREVCRDTCVIECGHIFCHDCIHEAAKHHSDCPSCRASFTVIQSSPWHTSKIRGLPVHCCYRECTYTDALQRITEHERTCVFRPVPCVICKKDIWYKDQATHSVYCPRRLVPCPHCDASVPWEEMASHHQDTCESILLACPNSCFRGDGCACIYVRREWVEHRTVCELEVVACCYQTMGCTHLLPRREVVAHEAEVAFHFPLLAAHHRKQLDCYEKRLEDLHDQQELRIKQLESLVMTGPEKVTTHHHRMVLCQDTASHNCNACEKTIVEKNWYRCRTTCDYDLCIACFAKHRVIKNKETIRTEAMYRMTQPEMAEQDYLPVHPDLEAGKVVHFAHPFVLRSVVRRGPQWVWGDQDGNGKGHVISIVESFLLVAWEVSLQLNLYRAGVNNEYDLVYA